MIKLLLPFLLLFFCSDKNFQRKLQQENHPPVVKIIEPENNSVYAPNVQVSYKISVSDKEDGDSKYDEIPANEVLLRVKYFADPSKIPSESNTESEAAGLTVMRTSNCFNCHAFEGKLIGPSFPEINQRYPPTPQNIELLVKRIKEGSSGVWGNVPMPTHPELSKEEMQNMVAWILKNSTEPGVSYYLGTEGSFRLKTPLVKGSYMLTASYIDHGTEDHPKQKLSGQDVVVISIK